MRIKINEDEVYEIKVPEEVDAPTFAGFFERLKIIKMLISKVGINSSNGKERVRYDEGYTSVLLTDKEKIKHVLKLFHNRSEEAEEELKGLCEKNNLPYNRSRLSIALSYCLKKFNLNKEKLLNE